MPYQILAARPALLVAALAILLLAPLSSAAPAQSDGDFDDRSPTPSLRNPAPSDWLMWRRTLDGWGYSPLDRIARDHVAELRLIWSRGIAPGSQQATPLAYGGCSTSRIPGTSSRRSTPSRAISAGVPARPAGGHSDEGLSTTNRNLALYGNRIVDTSADGYVFALDAATGQEVWLTRILDYDTHAALQSSGPIIAGGKVISGRSCSSRGGSDACVIVAHDATTGAELWRRRTIPAPGEPGDETWGGVPFEERRHVGAWMVPSYDPALNLVYVGTSVTSPAPKFLLGGADLAHLYHNSTLALDADTGEIRWYYQHLNDHWDLDHPFERLLVDTAVSPDPAAVA